MADAKSLFPQEKYETANSNLGESYCYQNSMSQEKKNRLIAAIDFGTTYSGYAFGFENEMSMLKDPLKSIHTNEWTASTGISTIQKAPTTVLFDPKGNFHSFGFKAENKYAELVEDENKDHTKWRCFKRFKMKLHDKIQLKRKFEIEDENGNIMPAKEIFSASIKFIKNDLERTLKDRNPGFVVELWVITVPAIWDEPAKQFMRESAEEAGIKSRIILALEPEAAAIYCKTLPYGSFKETSDKELAACFSPGGMYMILDLGGGTVDTAVHGVRDDISIKEIHKASGGAWGGTKVDEEFQDHNRKLFGNEIIAQIVKGCPSEWLDFSKRFEEKKRQVSYSKEHKEKIAIPNKLYVYCLSNNKVSNLTQLKTNLIISDEDLKGFFESPAKKIESHVRDILKKFPKLLIIFMVGGFSESKYIQEYMREKFPETRIIVPLNARLAVLKGAVIIGFNELSRSQHPKNTANSPLQVTERICRWTYGIRVYTSFIEGKHLEEYSFFIDGMKNCRNIFHVMVKEGESVAMFEERSDEFGTSHKEKERRHIDLNFSMFAVQGDIPTYTTDDSCKYLGKIVVKPPNEGWPDRSSFQVIMYFGNTEFSVKVLDKIDSNREPYIATFDFLG